MSKEWTPTQATVLVKKETILAPSDSQLSISVPFCPYKLQRSSILTGCIGKWVIRLQSTSKAQSPCPWVRWCSRRTTTTTTTTTTAMKKREHLLCTSIHVHPRVDMCTLMLIVAFSRPLPTPIPASAILNGWCSRTETEAVQVVGYFAYLLVVHGSVDKHGLFGLDWASGKNVQRTKASFCMYMTISAIDERGERWIPQSSRATEEQLVGVLVCILCSGWKLFHPFCVSTVVDGVLLLPPSLSNGIGRLRTLATQKVGIHQWPSLRHTISESLRDSFWTSLPKREGQFWSGLHWGQQSWFIDVAFPVRWFIFPLMEKIESTHPFLVYQMTSLAWKPQGSNCLSWLPRKTIYSRMWMWIRGRALDMEEVAAILCSSLCLRFLVVLIRAWLPPLIGKWLLGVVRLLS